MNPIDKASGLFEENHSETATDDEIRPKLYPKPDIAKPRLKKSPNMRITESVSFWNYSKSWFSRIIRA